MCLLLSWLLVALLAVQRIDAQTLQRFDMTNGKEAQEWQPQHDISRVTSLPDGLHIEIKGDDPYLMGPARDYPPNSLLWLRVRLKSEQSGLGQVFYFAEGSGPTEQNSVRFAVHSGRWDDVRLPLPALGSHYRLRFDPPGSSGTCVLASLSVEPRLLITPPVWPKPLPFTLGADALTLQSGLLSLTHAHHQHGGYVLRVGDQTMAVGHTHPLVGYRVPSASTDKGSRAGAIPDSKQGEVRWVDVSRSSTMTATMEDNEIVVRATCHDSDGATWFLHRSFRAVTPNTIHVLTTVQSDRDREIVYLPLLLLLPGVGPEGDKKEGDKSESDTKVGSDKAGSAKAGSDNAWYGASKSQAIFAGLEYLDRDEPSSSEADIHGPGAQRQTPDSAKITLPLMAIQKGANYIGLIWDKPQDFTALFDSPDRSLNAGGHVMGLLYPGSDGSNRLEGSLVPYEGQLLKANKPLVLSATIIGGRGADITAAIQQYVALRGLPPVPKPALKWQDYVRLASAGYLESGIYAGDRYRHAYPNFPAQPAGDVALFLDWLAAETSDRTLQSRLLVKASAARSQVPDADLNFAAIGHVRYPAPAMLYGHVEENALKALQNAQGLLARFEANGVVRYHAPVKGEDLGKTHFAPDANGLTAQVVMELLQYAVFTGDSNLIDTAIAKLRGLDKFAHTVPRGAQTWEVPLHTPDILASAYLLRAYTLGYEITGDVHFLEQAKYWAWTGVPFVYLVNPTDQAVGPYATIAVYGATQWVAPNWMGLPVQWCGLVYADALYRLVKYDPAGPWNQIANGITASGIQQTWPRGLDTARQGLLPDSFNLRVQSRNDAAINPGTLLVNALRLYNRPALYDFQVFREAGIYVHAPCDIDNERWNGVLLKDAPAANKSKPGGAMDVKSNDVKSDTGSAFERNSYNVRSSGVRTAAFGMNNVKAVAARSRLAFTTHGWTQQPYNILISGLKFTPVVYINKKEVTLAAPNQFSLQTGRLVLQVKGVAQIEIDAK